MSRDEYKGYYDDVYDELYHYGIKGQKWGIRRYQNPDGSLTEEGRRRYLKLYRNDEDRTKAVNKILTRKERKQIVKLANEYWDAVKRDENRYEKEITDAGFYNSQEYKEYQKLFADMFSDPDNYVDDGEAADYLDTAKLRFGERKGIKEPSGQEAWDAYVSECKRLAQKLVGDQQGAYSGLYLYEINGTPLEYTGERLAKILVQEYGMSKSII